MKKVKELSEKNLSGRTVRKKSKEKNEGFFFFSSSWFLGWKEKRKKNYKKKKTKGMIFYFDKNHFSIPSLETKKQLKTSYFTGYYL